MQKRKVTTLTQSLAPLSVFCLCLIQSFLEQFLGVIVVLPAHLHDLLRKQLDELHACVLSFDESLPQCRHVSPNHIWHEIRPSLKSYIF